MRRRGTSRNKRRQLVLSAIGIAVVVLVVTILLLHIVPGGGLPENTKPRALVADSLSLDYPNPKLVDSIVAILKENGYEVDLVIGRSVDMALYSKLTDYDLIVLRIHGGKAVYKTPDGKLHRINGLFTGLEWRDDYNVFKREWIATRAFPYNSTKAYLAVLPKFFETRLEGRFRPGSVMIVASCYSLYTREIADILASKGLSMFIGWKGPVTLTHMDKALELLIEKAVAEHMGWEKAVEEVNKLLGPDPLYGEKLEAIVYRR